MIKKLFFVFFGVVVVLCLFVLFSEDYSIPAFGELYFHNETPAVAVVSAADTYYNFDMFVVDEFKGFDMGGGYYFVVLYDGIYKADYSMSFGDGANNEFHVAVGVNGVEMLDCHTARKLGTAGDIGNMDGSCLLSLNSGDVVTLMYENEGFTSNMLVSDASFNLLFVDW